MRLDLYHNPSEEDVLKAIGLSKEDIPRFRGAGVDGDKICVHTRTGGGNRDYYESAKCAKSNYPEDFTDGREPSGPFNCDLRKNPYFLYDEDDDFDSTYANFWFSIPREHQKIKETENKKAKAIYGDAPTAIGILFGDKESIKKAQDNLTKLTSHRPNEDAHGA